VGSFIYQAMRWLGRVGMHKGWKVKGNLDALFIFNPFCTKGFRCQWFITYWPCRPAAFGSELK
jgi:hypothetical protein